MSGIDNREFIIKYNDKLYGIDINYLREEIIIEDFNGLLARVNFKEIDTTKNNEDIIEEIKESIEELNFKFEEYF